MVVNELQVIEQIKNIKTLACGKNNMRAPLSCCTETGGKGRLSCATRGDSVSCYLTGDALASLPSL